jgi:asparagine synthetase B (glutamine-hydrolysing)
MLISAGTIIQNASGENAVSTPSRDICWHGFVYKSGLRAGAESIRELFEVREADIPRAASALKGIYLVAVHCKDSGNVYVFVDQAGLCHGYYSNRQVSTSFLEIAKLEGYTAADADPEALVEFLHFGCVYEERTFFSAIRKIKADEILRYSANGSLASIPKPVTDIATLPERSFDDVLQDFATAARAERISMDITGGADSRLLACALAHFGLPFETATSGRPGIPDLQIGAEVAKVLERPFYPTYHSGARADWDELFTLSDAMFDVTKNCRQLQLQHDRRKRGITLSVSGAAGEAFRETWWMHDFPLYKRRKPNLARLYALRIAPHPLQHWLLAGRYKECSERQRENLLRRVSRHAVPGNTRTYDRVYYYLQFRTWSGTFVTSSMKLLNVALPYADLEMVRIGYNLPRTQRMLSRFHRKMISRYSAAAAALPSTEAGVSLASGGLALSLDLSRYLADRSKRLAKKVGQQLLGRTFFQESSDDPRMFDELLRTMANRKSTQVLADYGVLRHAVRPSSLPRRYLGTVFVLGQFFEQIGVRAECQTAPAELLGPIIRQEHPAQGIALCASITV